LDPELIGPDPVWKCIKSGKGHIYYALALAFFLNIAVAAGAPWWLCTITGGLIGGVFADCWGHEVLH
jgi:hypothetical protein